jgi:hypothetical protein
MIRTDPLNSLQVPFQPVDGFRVQVVGRLVEQQQVRFGKQQLAQRDAAALAAGQIVDRGVGRRAAQGFHRHFHLAFQVPQVLGVDLVLERRRLLGGLVGVVHHQLVVAVELGLLVGNALHDVFHHGLGVVELRLLRQVADLGALGGPGLAGILLVDTGHDLQKRRLAGPVRTQDADLGVRVEGQVDVVEDLLVVIGLGEAVHVIDELARHGAPLLHLKMCRDSLEFCGVF